MSVSKSPGPGSEPPYLGLFLFSPCAGILAALFGLIIYDHEGPWLRWGPAAVVSAWALIALYGILGGGPRPGLRMRRNWMGAVVVLFLYCAVLWWIVGHTW